MVLMGTVIATTAAMASSFAATALLAEEITGSETLASLAAGSMSLGSVAAAVPLARRMARLGRRRGLTAGWSVGALGALCAVGAALTNQYPLVVLGIIGVGAGNATNLAARYAAADLASEEGRARAIGWLVWASTFGAVAGPTLALGTATEAAEWIGMPDLAGPYILSAAMFLVGISITHALLRPDPLEVLGTLGSSAAKAASPLAVCRRIAGVPAARLAVLAMLMGQAVMVGVMTLTPLHMRSGGQGFGVIGNVISLHIVGMYAFSPVVGWLVDKISPRLTIAVGGLTLFVGAEMAGHTDPQHSTGITVGLLLVGLGWSFGLISGSALLTDSFPASQRVEVQGGADFMMTTGGAVAGLMSGAAVEQIGFQSFSHYAGLSALLLIAAAAATLVSARLERTRTHRLTTTGDCLACATRATARTSAASRLARRYLKIAPHTKHNINNTKTAPHAPHTATPQSRHTPNTTSTTPNSAPRPTRCYSKVAVADGSM